MEDSKAKNILKWHLKRIFASESADTITKNPGLDPIELYAVSEDMRFYDTFINLGLETNSH